MTDQDWDDAEEVASVPDESTDRDTLPAPPPFCDCLFGFPYLTHANDCPARTEETPNE